MKFTVSCNSHLVQNPKLFFERLTAFEKSTSTNETKLWIGKNEYFFFHNNGLDQLTPCIHELTISKIILDNDVCAILANLFSRNGTIRSIHFHEVVFKNAFCDTLQMLQQNEKTSVENVSICNSTIPPAIAKSFSLCLQQKKWKSFELDGVNPTRFLSGVSFVERLTFSNFKHFFAPHILQTNCLKNVSFENNQFNCTEIFQVVETFKNVPLKTLNLETYDVRWKKKSCNFISNFLTNDQTIVENLLLPRIPNDEDFIFLCNAAKKHIHLSQISVVGRDLRSKSIFSRFKFRKSVINFTKLDLNLRIDNNSFLKIVNDCFQI